MEIKAAGFAVDPKRIVEETISGASASAQRPKFKALLDRLEEGDVLLVTKIDRLGRDVIDVVSTVNNLKEMGVWVHCLQLGGTDLTSAAGRMTMNIMASVAQFERDLLIERTHAGLQRAWAEGKKSGRKPALSATDRTEVQKALASGMSVAQAAREFQTSRQTIMRVRAPSAEVTA
jgi:putative DNA-invertase from lambdoid prophage Rac